MTTKKLAAVLCAFAMSTAMLTACGDSDSSSDSAKKDDKTTTTTTAAAEDSEAPAESEAPADSTADTEAPAESTAEESKADAPAGTDIDFTYQTKFQGYDAFLMFGDANWRFGNWNGTGEETEGFGIDADITGDGEYTVTLDNRVLGPDDRINENADMDEDGDVVPAQGCVVFCVDIIGICDGTTNYEGNAMEKNALKDAEDGKNYPNIAKDIKGKFKGDGSDVKVQVTSIKADGQEIEFDPSKIVYGNIEDNNNAFRIEIYNDYGKTKEDSPIDKDALTFKKLEVTFTIEGLGEVGPFDAPAWAQ